MSKNTEEEKRPDELKKLETIATDMELAGKMRIQAVDQLGEIGTHEALLVLLSLAANDKLNIDERVLALKRAKVIVKKGR